MKKKLLAYVLALCMVLSLMPVAALADEVPGGVTPPGGDQVVEPAAPTTAPEEETTDKGESEPVGPSDDDPAEGDEEPSESNDLLGYVQTFGALEAPVEVASALPDAVDGVITLTQDVALTTAVKVTSTVTIDGQGKYSIYPAENMTQEKNAVIWVTGTGELTLKDVTVDAKGTGRVMLCNGSSKLHIEGATVTGGAIDGGYIAGIYMTDSSVFTMNGGEISGNTITGEYASDGYLEYTADLWVGANATGTLNTMEDGHVGCMFVNSNEYSEKNPGAFTMNGGTVDNLYVEYDKGYGGSFKFTDGAVGNLYLSTKVNGTPYMTTAVKGTDYKGGVAAEVGDKFYCDLASAISAAAEDNGTVILCGDVTEDVVIPKEKTVTLDLNGHTLTSEASHAITNNGNLTVEDTSADKSGVVDGVVHAYGALDNRPGATAVLNGGEFTRSKENGKTNANNGGNSWYAIRNHGTMTINENVKVTQDGNYSSLIENGYFDGGGENTTNNTPKLTIEGGLFDGGLNTIKNDDYGDLTINGGTFKNISQNVLMNFDIAKVTGGNFEAGAKALHAVENNYGNDTMDRGQLTIEGGNFDGVIYTNKGTISIEDGKFNSTFKIKNAGVIAISGGLFSSDPSNYVAADKMAVTSDNAEYPFTIADKATDAVVVVAAPDVKVSNTATDETKVAAAAIGTGTTVDGLAATASAVVNDPNKIPGSDAKEVTDALSEAGITLSEDETVTIVVEPYLEITVNEYDTTNKTLSLAIDPKYNVVATTDPDNIIKEPATGKTQNAVDVKKGLDMPKSTKTNVTITIPLPDGFTDAEDLTVKHVKANGKVYYYTAAVSTVEGKKFATFTVTHGFSDFTIQAQDARTLTINFDSSVGSKTYSITDVGVQSFPSASKSGYTFNGWKIGGTVYTELSDALWTAVMGNQVGDQSVSATAQFTKTGGGSTGGGGSSSGGGGGSSSSTYSVSVGKTTGGSVSLSPKKASKGDTVTLTVKPDAGYELDELVVTDKSGERVKLTDKGDGKFTFKMPGSAVTVEASFVKVGEKDTDKTADKTELPFTDVAAADWYADAARFVYENGLMAGTSGTTFGPDVVTTRGMIVTILYRLEGEPAVTDGAFADVAPGQYYTSAVAWAASNGVVTGYDNGGFGPNDPITREQMAAILYRYAQLKGYDVSRKADLSVYADGGAVSTYAAEALAWANAAGLVTGTSATTLAPQGQATRAQVATILMRFCENVAK